QSIAVVICIIAGLYKSSRCRLEGSDGAVAVGPVVPPTRPSMPPRDRRYRRSATPTPTVNGARKASLAPPEIALQPLRRRRSSRVRLFRADTPHDVASACLVAGISPGQDYLAISADKAASDRDDYLLTMREMARAHQWVDVFDAGGLPIGDHGWFNPDA